MDVVTGSAKTGQTYLFWHGDQLFQTHISYLTTTDEWIPSPGYEATEVDCTRVIRTACLDCHATFIQRIKAPNHYHRDTAVWGISCETLPWTWQATRRLPPAEPERNEIKVHFQSKQAYQATTTGRLRPVSLRVLSVAKACLQFPSR